MTKDMLGFVAVSPKEQIRFKCVGCGACCRNVCLSVPVETLDAFRIAKYLRERDKTIQCIDDFWARCCEPALLDECGYFVYFLKTRGDDNACVFLEDGRCTIHSVNPRACRTYPFTVDPETGQYLLTREREHHFKGPPVKAKTWMKQRLSEEDCAFIQLDFESTPPLGVLLKTIAKRERHRAVMLFQYYKYSDFDLDQPFLEQYRRNIEKLTHALGRLINNEKEV